MAAGEVEVGELAVEGVGGAVAGAGGGALAFVGAEPVALSIVVDAGVPLALLLAPADADVLRGAVLLRALVAGVLALGAEAQVVLHVGQAVVVDVVDDEAGRGVHDDAVHADLPLALGADGVEGVRLPRGAGDPPEGNLSLHYWAKLHECRENVGLFPAARMCKPLSEKE